MTKYHEEAVTEYRWWQNRNYTFSTSWAGWFVTLLWLVIAAVVVVAIIVGKR